MFCNAPTQPFIIDVQIKPATTGAAHRLQADAYKGFLKLKLYAPAPITGQRRVKEAACWAHWRRDFHDVWKLTKSPIAQEALERIGKLYMIERQINGRPLDERLAVRQTKSKPLAAAFKAWLEQQLPKISAKSDLARAIRYGLSRWQSFTLFLEEEPTVAIGRVGDWRGGVRNWGVVVFQLLSRHAGASFQSIAPFPVAAHQTGRADFPHPAFS
ncbi:MAG: transposase [Anaerolineales bacterium]|nr:transposase [Anaerolineales bacterium]